MNSYNNDVCFESLSYKHVLFLLRYGPQCPKILKLILNADLNPDPKLGT
jgi:hypothetical protein